MTTETAPRFTRDMALDRGDYVQKVVAAALQPGGPLYGQLSDLISEATGIAMDAAGIPDDDDDRGADWPMDHAQVVEDAAHAISEAMFRATTAYLRPDKPQLSIQS